MAFSYAVTDATISGNRKVVSGTYTNTDTDSGGAITTGLSFISNFQSAVTSHVGAAENKVTISGGTVTLVTGNGVDGTWRAEGI